MPDGAVNGHEAFQPLAGVRVLDWAEGVAGPYACQLMADLGADVVKVERPQGDWGRGSGSGPTRAGSHFRALNRNKRNICLDLRKPDGVKVALKLIARADVLVTAYRPGVTERLGIGYADVRERNASVIYVRISAYGYSGQLSERPGSDTILQATSGLMSQIGDPDGDPQRVGVPVIDFLAARDATIAVLTGLLARSSGRPVPGPVDVSLFGSAATFQAQLWQSYLDTGVVPRRTGHRNPSLAPAGLFATADGRHIAVAVLRDEHFAKLCNALDLPELAADPRFATNADRLANRDELEAVIGPVFASRGFGEWVDRLLDADVLAGPVTGLADIESDPGFAAALPTVPLTGAEEGARSIGFPIRVDDVRIPPVASAPAGKGQHTRDVLKESGFTPEEVEQLVASGAVHVEPDG